MENVFNCSGKSFTLQLKRLHGKCFDITVEKVTVDKLYIKLEKMVYTVEKITVET